MKLLNIFTSLKSLAAEHPYASGLIILAIVLLLITVIVEHLIYEHIECRVTENGRSRNTVVKRHKRNNSYKLHKKTGKWEPLAQEHIDTIETFRKKFALRIKQGHHLIPELVLS